MKNTKKVGASFSKIYLYLVALLISLNLCFGAWYLVVLMEKVKANDYLGKLMQESGQLNADISRIKLEIDKQVDLSNVQYRATNELQMQLITDVNYISVK